MDPPLLHSAGVSTAQSRGPALWLTGMEAGRGTPRLALVTHPGSPAGGPEGTSQLPHWHGFSVIALSQGASGLWPAGHRGAALPVSKERKCGYLFL